MISNYSYEVPNFDPFKMAMNMAYKWWLYYLQVLGWPCKYSLPTSTSHFLPTSRIDATGWWRLWPFTSEFEDRPIMAFPIVHLGSRKMTPNRGPISEGHGCFQKLGYPKLDGLEWKTLLKWMIWGYPYFWKPPHVHLPTIPTTIFQQKESFVSFGTSKKRNDFVGETTKKKRLLT